MDVVLDSSVAMCWLLQDEKHPYADQVEAWLQEHRAIVPPLWLYEVVNVLRQASRRGRISEDYERWALGFLVTLPIVVDAVDPMDHGLDISRLAALHNLTAYDAAYLELAVRHGLPLATLDERLALAASAERVYFGPREA